jgi:PIN domain nuclease of toxin-antitoxin system
MSQGAFLFDTHALIFWVNRTGVTDEFIQFFDNHDRQGTLRISSISLWEIGLLVKKDRIAVKDVHAWKNNLLISTNIQLIEPTAAEMIDSTLLADHHKDPFDRLLIAQAHSHKLALVTKDALIQQYDVETFWI